MSQPSQLCICCLQKQEQYISLLSCSHAEFLSHHPIMEINTENQLICYQCHNILKKIKLFKHQVDESFKLLSGHENIPGSSYRKQNLQIYKMENIEIVHNDTNDSKTGQNFHEEKTTIENPTTGITSINNSTTEKNAEKDTNKSMKLKNIENALKIINNNQNDVCMSVLAASLQNISKTLLNGNLNILNDLKLNLNLPERSQKNYEGNNLEENLDNGIKNKTFDIDQNILKQPILVKDASTYKILSKRLNRTKPPFPSKIKKITITKEELMKERLETIASHTYAKSLYRCENCLIGFFYPENLEDHLKRKHNPKQDSISCDVCFQSVNPGLSYDQHISRHFTRYDCIVCSRRFSSIEVALFHYRRKHCESLLYKCKHCPFITPVKNCLRNHFRSHRVGKISSVKSR